METARKNLSPRTRAGKPYPGSVQTWKVLFVFLVMVVSPFYLFSQACCSGGVPLGGSLGLGSAESRTLQLLLTYDYNLLNDLMDGKELLQDDTRSRTTHAAMLEVNYGLSSRFSLAALLPFIQQERNIKGFEQGREFTSTRGLGDVVFLLKYRMLNPASTSGTEWVVGAGPKLPTAHTRHTNNNGLLLPADMQPGSGSLDGILWSFFQRDQVFSPALSFISVATYRYSGANNNYNESQSYRFGNEFQLNMGMNYNFFINRPMDVFSYLRYRHQGEDLIDGSVFPGSGGQWLYWVPGLAMNFTPDMSLRLSAAVPVYRKLEGAQLTTTYRFTIALSYAINPKQPVVLVPTDNPL